MSLGVPLGFLSDHTPRSLREARAAREAERAAEIPPTIRFFLVDTGERELDRYNTAKELASDIASGQFDLNPIETIWECATDAPMRDVCEDVALKAWEIVSQTYTPADEDGNGGTFIDPFIRSHVHDLDRRIAEIEQNQRDEDAHVREIYSFAGRL